LSIVGTGSNRTRKKCLRFRNTGYKKSGLGTDLDGQLDGERLCGHRLRTVVLLQELAHCLRVPADGVRLPLVVGPARVRLHQHSDKKPVSRDSRDDFFPMRSLMSVAIIYLQGADDKLGQFLDQGI
jgi:hypothetical protein